MEDAGRVAEDDKRPNTDGAETLLLAFTELSTERQNGMQPGPIPISKIWEYADRFELDDWALTYQVARLDRQLLKQEA